MLVGHGAGSAPSGGPTAAVGGDFNLRSDISRTGGVEPALEFERSSGDPGQVDRSRGQTVGTADCSGENAVEVDPENSAASGSGGRVGKEFAGQSALAGRIAELPLTFAGPARVGVEHPLLDRLRSPDGQVHRTGGVPLMVGHVSEVDDGPFESEIEIALEPDMFEKVGESGQVAAFP